MPWWAWVLLGLFIWLYMVRLTLRLDIESGEFANNPNTLTAEVVLIFFLWWVAIFFFLDPYYKKKYAALGKTSSLTSFKFTGESKWHKKERLAKEHEERANSVEMPVQ